MSSSSAADAAQPPLERPPDSPVGSERSHGGGRAGGGAALRFACQQTEAAFQQHATAAYAAQDWTAAWLYAAMVLPGTVTIVLAATLMPPLWNAHLAGCATMTVTTSAVLVAHLCALTWLAPATYRAVRAPLIATVRLAYALSGVCWGLQTCSTVTKWVAGDELESPFSALLWRPGIIALVWHAAAFRLPFWQHVAVQGATAAAYCACLAGPVCASLACGVQHGAVLAGLAASWADVWWVVSQLVSMAVVGGVGVLSDEALQWLTAASATPAPDAGHTCVAMLRAWQLAVGFVAVTLALYALEAADRARWWRQQQEAGGRAHGLP